MTAAFIAPNFDGIPAELRRLPRWVTWRAESEGSKTKPRKTPYRADLPHTRASSTDPETWCSFEQAEAAYLDGDRTGVGLVLDGTGDLAGVDIDGCRDAATGTVEPAALALLESLGAGYVEVSPSGTGLRAFGYAPPLETGAAGTLDGLKVEVYSKGRYLTLTGQTIKAGPIAPLQGFGGLAERIRASRKVNPETGEIERSAPGEHHAELVRRIMSGDVFHDSLRDLAASLVATGMQPGAVVNHLRGLMDACAAPRDDRWQSRRAQIPGLVSSAAVKYAPAVADSSALLESSKANNESRFKLLGRDDPHALPPLEWRVRGVLPAVGVAALFGPSASGKSFLGFDLAAYIAEGRHWFGRRVKAAPVVYLALEGEAGFKLRAEAWEQAHGRTLPPGLRLVLQGFKLAGDVPDLAAAILAAVGAGAVVFVDTLNRAAPMADENSSRDMGEILEGTKQLQRLTAGLVVLIHHTGKDATRGLRGHSSLFAAMDAAVEVSREGDRREWKVSKSKDGADGDAHPFRLEVVNLAPDDEGEPVSSCVVRRDVSAADVQRVKLPQGGNQRLALEALRPMFKASQVLGMGGAPPQRPCIELEAAVTAGAARMTCPTDRRATRAREAITGLVSRGVLACCDGWVWLP
jgi:hypothetical protein